MVAQPEIVVAIVDRDRLSAALTGLHRSGYGHVTRVLDPDRADVAGQLERAGSEIPIGFGGVTRGQVIVMVSAPARTRVAAELLRRLGATKVWETERVAAMAAPVLFGSVNRRARARHEPRTEPVAD
jgi:hypothetical protein